MWAQVSDDVFVHPTALVESADVGAGTRVWAYAHIMDGATVGRECKIGDHTFVESGAVVGDRVTIKNGCLIWHGVVLGNEVFVGPGVVFTNDLTPRVRYQTGPGDWLATVVGPGASIGANSTIVCGITIGANAMVGAGSVVTKDVPDHGIVWGNPARRNGWACECGSRLPASLACAVCGRNYVETEVGLAEATGR